jgi:hypothetical protein
LAPPPLLPPNAPPPPAVPAPPPPKLWSGGLEFGITGAEGNSENFKVRLGGNTEYKTPDNLFKGDFIYSYATANGLENENRFIGNARHEWLFPGQAWNVFVRGSLEVDAFTAFDYRVAAHTGVGYEFWKTPGSSLKGRAGIGGSQEIGGPRDHFIPEALVGVDAEHKLSDRQKFTLVADAFPDVRDPSDYRIIARAAYELLVDPEWNLTLKLGALDRYDSTPEGRRRNDLEYFMVLLWKY